MKELVWEHQRFSSVIMEVLKHSKFRDLISSGLLSPGVLEEEQSSSSTGVWGM